MTNSGQVFILCWMPSSDFDCPPQGHPKARPTHRSSQLSYGDASQMSSLGAAPSVQVKLAFSVPQHKFRTVRSQHSLLLLPQCIGL